MRARVQSGPPARRDPGLPAASPPSSTWLRLSGHTAPWAAPPASVRRADVWAGGGFREAPERWRLWAAPAARGCNPQPHCIISSLRIRVGPSIKETFLAGLWLLPVSPLRPVAWTGLGRHGCRAALTRLPLVTPGPGEGRGWGRPRAVAVPGVPSTAESGLPAQASHSSAGLWETTLCSKATSASEKLIQTLNEDQHRNSGPACARDHPPSIGPSSADRRPEDDRQL